MKLLLACLSFYNGRRARSASAWIELGDLFLSSFRKGNKLPLSEHRYKRLSGCLPSNCADLDTIWDIHSLNAARALTRQPAVVVIDESICKLTHVIDDPAEHRPVIMPRNPAGVGALSYLLATNVCYSGFQFLVVGSIHLVG